MDIDNCINTIPMQRLLTSQTYINIIDAFAHVT